MISAFLAVAACACQNSTTQDGNALCAVATEATFNQGSCNSTPEKSSAASSLPKPAEKAEPVAPDLANINPAATDNGLVVPPFLRGSSDMTGAIPAKASVAPPPERARSRRAITLYEAAAQAAFSHPEISAAEARVREAKAGVRMATAGLYPQGDTRLAVGGSLGGNAAGRNFYERTNPDGNARIDASISLKQLLFDFGATRADVERASYLKDAEKLKLLDKVDEIVLKTAQAYLKILETRALLGLVDETVAAHRRLAAIVQANEREGNGTTADVNRVSSRLTDINAIRSDVSLQLAGAEEQFHRLTQIHPGALAGVPSLAPFVPPSAEAAIGLMKRNNPRLAAIGMQSASIEKEIEFQRGSALPKFQIETDADTKNYAALNRNKNETEARALITMRYKFMDGGLANATVEQLNHRREGNLHQLRNENEQISADLRQAYRAVDSARRKGRLVAEGVLTSAKVQELYLEQFKAGRRTVFELLDSQMSSFTVRRSAIESRYEAERAIFDILRNSGRLAEALSQASSSKMATGTIPQRPAGASADAARRAAAAVNDVSQEAGDPATYPVSQARLPKRIPEAQLPVEAKAAGEP
jgi:outer membrane protein TolC